MGEIKDNSQHVFPQNYIQHYNPNIEQKHFFGTQLSFLIKLTAASRDLESQTPLKIRAPHPVRPVEFSRANWHT